MTRRIATIAAAALSLFALASEFAEAKIGTGVGAAPITLAAPAHAGKTYDLPSLWVVNTGDETSIYRVGVELGESRRDARTMKRTWVQVEQSSFELTPGQGRWVALSLRIPSAAAGGSYNAKLVAGTVRSNAGGAGVGASAATELRFTVAGASPAAAADPSGDSGVWLVSGALALAAVATAARRRARNGSKRRRPQAA